MSLTFDDLIPQKKPAASFDRESVFAGALQPGWKITSGFRSPSKEAGLRASGAGTVPAGQVSDHSRGSPADPGGYDLVAPGQTAQGLLKHFRDKGLHVSMVYDEPAQGGQGRHFHVRMGQSVGFDDLVPKKAATAPTFDDLIPKQSAFRNIPGRPEVRPGPKGFLDELGREVQHDIGEAARIVSTPKFPTPEDVGTVIGAPFKVASEPGRIAQRALQRSVSKAPESEEDIRQQQFVGDLSSAAVPIPGAAEVKGAEEVTAAAAKTADRLAKLAVSHVIGKEVDPIERIDNAFYRAGGRATSGKVEAAQTLRSIPKHLRDPALQERLTHAVERKMVDPKAKIPDDLKEAEAVRAPWAERQRVAVNAIREHLKAKGMGNDVIEAYAPSSETGYVPRRVVGHSPALDAGDPAGAGRNPLQFQLGRSGKLRTRTGSLQARTQFVEQKGAKGFGQRRFVGTKADAEAAGIPESRLKPATIAEIEANTPIRYHKNALVNTIDQALTDERVLDNLHVLDEATKQMKADGLAHHFEWMSPGRVMRGPGRMSIPEGFREVHGVPALRGWAFDPKVADLLHDVLKGQSDQANVLNTVTRAINASLFITPFPHIKNVATMAAIGRGWDALNPLTIPRFIRTFADATKETFTLGPKYRAWLREGGALQSGDDATRNFYESMMRMAGQSITKDKATQSMVARAFGLPPAQVVKALYDASHKFLWQANDALMLQRYLELAEKGMAPRDAIKETERWIANYRVPPQIFKSRAFQQFMMKSGFVNFPRYDYGKWKVLGEMYRGVAHGTPAQKLDTLGKIVMLGVTGAFVYPLMDQMLKTATGNPNAYFPRGGEVGPIEGALNLPHSLGAGTPSFSPREKDWAGDMSAFLTPSPAIELFTEGLQGRYGWSGEKIIDPYSSTRGKIAQGAEFGAGMFYPAQLGLDLAKPGGGMEVLSRLAGGSAPQTTGEPKGRVVKMLKSQAKRRERRDAAESLIP